MKLVIAIIRPEKLEAVQAALKRPEVCLLSVSEVLSDGGELGPRLIYRSMEFRARRPKLRLEMAVKDPFVESTVEAVVRAAYPAEAVQTGEVKVVVLPLEACVLSMLAEEAQPPIPPRPVQWAR